MDFGVDGFVYEAPKNCSFASDNGSKCLRRDRALNEDDFRAFKSAKTDACGDEMLKIPLQSCNNDSGFIDGQSSQEVALPYFLQQTPNGSSRSTGMIGASIQGVLLGFKGPFTHSQWMELEHQALIYKYITANVPIPSYLLHPIRKALESAGFPTLSGLRSNSFGWGAFHLGFSNTDPEPGRCRRTDGKKWRCSRDAVADQKYCERHMNRGRHRSRKPVECQPGRSTSIIASSDSKLTPLSSSGLASVVPPGGGASNSLTHHPLKLLQPGIPALKSSEPAAILSMAVPAPTTTLHETQYSSPKPQNGYIVSSRPEFGFVNSDSLLNPVNRSTRLDNINGHKPQHLLRQFMDERPKSQPEHLGSTPWPDSELQPDRTQLTISIPMATPGLMSPPSSPAHQKLENTSWIPVSWEPSAGGPLAEVLQSASNKVVECENSKPFDVMDTWRGNSHRVESSPTGVLQKGAFGSISNSSAGSSPGAAESSRAPDGAGSSNGLVVPGLMNPRCNVS